MMGAMQAHDAGGFMDISSEISLILAYYEKALAMASAYI
jgi:hypothetical protein